MKTKLILLLLLTSVFSQIYSQTKNVKLVVSDDSYVFINKDISEPKGSEDYLQLRYSTNDNRRDVFLKFDLNDVALSVPYNKVLLKLYMSDRGYVGVPIKVLKIQHTEANYNWSESTLCTSNAPIVDDNDENTIAEIITKGDDTGQYLEFDITNWVNEEKGAGRNIISLQIKALPAPRTDESGKLPFKIYSKDKSTPNKPMLIITGERLKK